MDTINNSASHTEAAGKTARREEKMEYESKKFDHYLKMVEGWQSYLFRVLALLIVIGVEVCLLVAVFKEITIDAGLITAITILAVLPILVMRAFDITVLNLTKDGISAQMQREEIAAAAVAATQQPPGPAQQATAANGAAIKNN